MTKQRSRIPEEVAAELMFLSNRTCCICRDRGKAVQIHHINENPADHRVENLVPLCLQDHNDTQLRGGFGRHLSAAEVRKFRDDWFAVVAAGRAEQSTQMGLPVGVPPLDWSEPDKTLVLAYLDMLPKIRGDLRTRVEPGLASGTTAEMNGAAYEIIDGLMACWLVLAAWYPDNHFGMTAKQFVSSYVGRAFMFHRRIFEPGRVGTAGTILGQLVGGAVIDELDSLIASTVGGLHYACYLEDFDLAGWMARWKLAGRASDTSHP